LNQTGLKARTGAVLEPNRVEKQGQEQYFNQTGLKARTGTVLEPNRV